MKSGASIALLLVLAARGAGERRDDAELVPLLVRRALPRHAGRRSRHAADVAEVVPGDTLHTAAGTAGVELPAYLALVRLRRRAPARGHERHPGQGLDRDPRDQHAERVQVVGPIAVTATTTITVDPADDNRFLSATPFEYTTPVIPALDLDRGRRRRRRRAGRRRQHRRAAAGRQRRRAAHGHRQRGDRRRSSRAAPRSTWTAGRGRRPASSSTSPAPTYEPGPPTPFATVQGPKNLMCIGSGGARAGTRVCCTRPAPRRSTPSARRTCCRR